MMSPDLISVLARVQEELGAQIDILDREGGVYASRVLERIDEPPTLTGPRAPAGMNSHVSRMIRELTLDEVAGMRRLPASVLRGRRG